MPCVITTDKVWIMIRTYSDLSQLQTFEDRYQYLQLSGVVGCDTFGFDRYLNQIFYKSTIWKKVRDVVIVRDKGCDLGIVGHEIDKRIIIHHMNPISTKDIEYNSDFLMDPEFLITTMLSTHNAIHYGDENLLVKEPTNRSKHDTTPWR